MKKLSLRVRVFLFFCLLACGGVALFGLGLFVGFRQLGNSAALSSFVTAGLIGGFGLMGLVILIWLLFDENVSKPIEALAAGVRVRAHSDVAEEIDVRVKAALGLGQAASDDEDAADDEGDSDD